MSVLETMVVGAVALGVMAGCGESTASNGSESGGASGSGGAGVSGSGGASGSAGAGVGGSAEVSGSGGTTGRAGAGGSAGGGAGRGGTSGSGGAAGSGGSGDYFVSVYVDDVPIRAETNVRAVWFQGLLDGWLMVEGSTDEHQFYILAMNALSSDACSYMTLLELPDDPSMAAGSFVEGGVCDVTVTATALNVGDVFEGTFSGAVGKLGQGELTVLTEGRFRVPRVPDNTP